MHSASNRMTQRDNQAVQLDPAGNTLSDHGGQRTFQYNQRGRLWKLFGNGQLKAQYTYNASGQRTRKTLADGTETVYHYDSQGRLIAETSQPLRDYIWADDRPVAQIETHRDAAGKLHNDNIIYLFSDHLNTPRVGMNPNGNIIWRNDSVGFGEQAANDDPDGDGSATVVNLRFPGQYFDGESGLHYNWNRYYDPETGRYITSDPIGLDGGINTFGYVGGNPGNAFDLVGLAGSAVVDGARFGAQWGSRVGSVIPHPSGRLLGGLLGGGLGAAAGWLIPQAFPDRTDSLPHDPPEERCEDECPPCTPYPKGTIGYIGPHTDHDHYPIGRPHLNLFVVNQNPNSCKCFWNKNNPDASAPPPAPGWVDLNSGFPPLSP